jgi:hypothetical protein
MEKQKNNIENYSVWQTILKILPKTVLLSFLCKFEANAFSYEKMQKDLAEIRQIQAETREILKDLNEIKPSKKQEKTKKILNKKDIEQKEFQEIFKSFNKIRKKIKNQESAIEEQKKFLNLLNSKNLEKVSENVDIYENFKNLKKYPIKLSFTFLINQNLKEEEKNLLILFLKKQEEKNQRILKHAKEITLPLIKSFFN